MVATKCPACGKVYVPELLKDHPVRRPHLLIQQEFPRATPTQREQLLTGICSYECWDQFVGGVEEAYDDV